jgi:hypothetical protein
LILDVVLSMKTQYMEAGVWITDGKSKAINYLRTWFFLDFISTLPVDAFVWSSVMSTFWDHNSKSSETNQADLNENDVFFIYFFAVHMFLRAPRLLRLVWIVGKTTAQIEMHSQKAHYFLLVKLVGGILVLNHILACAYFLIADFQGFGSTPMTPPVTVEQAPFWVQYLYGFFWSTNVVTRVGGSVRFVPFPVGKFASPLDFLISKAYMTIHVKFSLRDQQPWSKRASCCSLRCSPPSSLPRVRIVSHCTINYIQMLQLLNKGYICGM